MLRVKAIAPGRLCGGPRVPISAWRYSVTSGSRGRSVRPRRSIRWRSRLGSERESDSGGSRALRTTGLGGSFVTSSHPLLGAETDHRRVRDYRLRESLREGAEVPMGVDRIGPFSPVLDCSVLLHPWQRASRSEDLPQSRQHRRTPADPRDESDGCEAYADAAHILSAPKLVGGSMASHGGARTSGRHHHLSRPARCRDRRVDLRRWRDRLCGRLRRSSLHLTPQHRDRS